MTPARLTSWLALSSLAVLGACKAEVVRIPSAPPGAQSLVLIQTCVDGSRTAHASAVGERGPDVAACEELRSLVAVYLDETLEQLELDPGEIPPALCDQTQPLDGSDCCIHRQLPEQDAILIFTDGEWTERPSTEVPTARQAWTYEGSCPCPDLSTREIVLEPYASAEILGFVNREIWLVANEYVQIEPEEVRADLLMFDLDGLVAGTAREPRRVVSGVAEAPVSGGVLINAPGPEVVLTSVGRTFRYDPATGESVTVDVTDSLYWTEGRGTWMDEDTVALVDSDRTLLYAVRTETTSTVTEDWGRAQTCGDSRDGQGSAMVFRTDDLIVAPGFQRGRGDLEGPHGYWRVTPDSAEWIYYEPSEECTTKLGLLEDGSLFAGAQQWTFRREIDGEWQSWPLKNAAAPEEPFDVQLIRPYDGGAIIAGRSGGYGILQDGYACGVRQLGRPDLESGYVVDGTLIATGDVPPERAPTAIVLVDVAR